MDDGTQHTHFDEDAPLTEAEIMGGEGKLDDRVREDVGEDIDRHSVGPRAGAGEGSGPPPDHAGEGPLR